MPKYEPDDQPETVATPLPCDDRSASSGMTVDEISRRRFESAWIAGHPETIEACLPLPDHPCYLATLEELVCIEVELTWKAYGALSVERRVGVDRPPLAESYLIRFPDLDRPERVMRILRQEFEARSRFVGRPASAEYCQRFPALVRTIHDLGFEESKALRSGATVRINGYDILGVIGRGGMGVVYRVRQHALNRVVALKMLLPNAVANPNDLQRFRTEVEATAALHHPSIVRVHEFSETGGQPYYTMELIDGPSLEQRLTNGPLPIRIAARYLAQIARAIHHAHQHGILHRDLKPSNILIDANDQSHVTDFGIAKRLSNDSGPTRTGSILGTPSYMAPEQASDSKNLTPAADVYGLGALLYALLTGRPPFLGESLTDTLLQVLEREPVPPRLLNPKVDRDLETICLKCLEKDPRKRYSSADMLATDLERFLSGDSIGARSVNVFDRIARALGRSDHDVEFQGWGTLLLLTGIIVFTCHSANFIAFKVGLPYWVRWITGTVQFTLIGLAFWRHRPGRLLPTSAPERQLWTIWIGYFVASATVALIDMQLVAKGDANAIPDGRADAIQWSIYPYSSLLAGFAFFVMGCAYWGGCYLIGIGFCIMAVLMPLRMSLAPLAFALTWSAALCTLGIRLRSLGQREPAPQATTHVHADHTTRSRVE